MREYYLQVAEVLRGEAEAASVFPSCADIGSSRERVYAEFLRQHAPSKCNVFLGGFLFDLAGAESRQMDVIVTTDTAPRFNFHNQDGTGKAFSPVEGTLAVASIKTQLDKTRLYEALDGIASIPPTQPLHGRVLPLVHLTDYEDWPYKIIYATRGLHADTLLGHLNDYYQHNAHIPLSRRPHVIHVAGQSAIFRVLSATSPTNPITGPKSEPAIGTFHLFTIDPDLEAIILVLDALQRLASVSALIFFNYIDMVHRV